MKNVFISSFCKKYIYFLNKSFKIKSKKKINKNPVENKSLLYTHTQTQLNVKSFEINKQK